MRTYLILREKAVAFNRDAEIQGILRELHRGCDAPLPASADLRSADIDPAPLAARRYHHEKLDQLVQELLLGVR